MQRQGGGQQYNRGGGQHYGGGGYRNDGYRGGYRGERDRGNDDGAIAAGALGGLLLGAIIANESQRNSNDCRRYRSYDPRSGTFVAGDGRRYRCR